MADPNLAGMPRRSRNSVRAARYWLAVLHGPRLREARVARGLSPGELAAGAGLSLRTVTRLEGAGSASCQRATLYRIAGALADDPEQVVTALTVTDTEPRNRRPGGEESSWLCSRMFPARPEQVRCVRRFIGLVLDGCPMTYDAQVICSELFTNSIQHSSSSLPGGRVTVRAQVRQHDYLWLEVEDAGGTWNAGGGSGDGGRGLEVVAALSDYWDIRGDEGRRLVCARIDWPGSES